jgi:tRNA pseudouridine13 synthase
VHFHPSPEDFEVEELPLPGAPGADGGPGEGAHVWVLLEKRGVSTSEAARRIAARLGRSAAAIGHAGLKDAHATTRQWISIEGLRDEERARIADDRVRPLAFARAPRKIAIGDLAGNRFRVRLRDVDADDLAGLAEALAAAESIGVPNFFGRQRFGIRGIGAEIGKAILLGHARAALALLLGRPSPLEGPRLREARALYEGGDWAGALRGFPASFDAERRALETLLRRAGPSAALEAVPFATREMYLAAYQASLFDRLLEERVALGTFASAEPGDALAPDGAPAGPLFGTDVALAEGEPGAREARLLAEEGITTASFGRPRGLALRGARRPYRLLPREVALEGGGEGALTLRFALPPGGYATTLVEALGARVEAPGP